MEYGDSKPKFFNNGQSADERNFKYNIDKEVIALSELQFKKVSDELKEVLDRYWVDTQGKCYKQLSTPYIRDAKLSRTEYKKIINEMKNDYMFYKNRYVIFKNGLILSEIYPSYLEKTKAYMFNLYLKQDTKEYMNVSLHRLMCVVWKKLDFYNKNLHVHHIDKNRDNNNIDNLEILTMKEHLKKHQKRIEIYKNNKLIKICSLKEAMEICNIKSSSSIYNVINGKRKQSKGYVFKEV